MTGYTVGFSVSSDGKREMFIETDDLQSLSDADWFREFLDLRIKQSSSDNLKQTETMLQLQALQQENSQLRQLFMQQQEQRQRQVQQVQQARPPASAVASSQQTPARPADELIKNIVTPQPQQPQQPQRRLPTSYLELTPDNITPDIWNTLNAEQQAQWLKKYNLG